MDPYQESICRAVKEALAEDIGRGDLTSLACLEPNPLKAKLVAKQAGVLSGLLAALYVYEVVDSANRVTPHYRDGDHFEKGAVIFDVDGFNQTILASERVALNFIAHLSGVATLTSKFVERTAGTNARILDTRKTTPGMRFLEKMAVCHGGGVNHRFGLYDMILIKDNHIASSGSIAGAEPVLLYVNDNYGTVSRPARQLKAFTKVFLKPGEQQTVRFTLLPGSLSFIGINNTRIIEPGGFTVTVGSMSRSFVLE